MIQKFDSLKQELSELASVLNSFKSEAVQLRILDFVLGAGSSEETVVTLKKNRVSRKTRTQSVATGKQSDGASGIARKKSVAGTGAPSTLNQLLEGAFFDKPRTINDVIEHCKHNLARTFKANEFSGKLGRMVREGELTRKKNADKQYEYKKP